MGVSERAKLTWEPKPRRWRKVYKGKTYTVPCRELGAPETKEASYQAANAWWTNKLVELEDQHPRHPHQDVLDEIDKRLAWAVRNGMGRTVQDLTEKRHIVQSLPEGMEDTALEVAVYSSELEERIEMAKAHGVQVDPHMNLAAKSILFGESQRWEERLQAEEMIPAEKTVAGLVKAWLANKEVEMRAGQLAPKRFDNLKYEMRSIESAMGSQTAVSRIDEQTVDRVYQYFMTAIADRKLARETAKTRWGLFRGLIRFGWTRRLYELPRNLDERSINSPPKTVPNWTVAEIKRTVAASSGQLRLALLLMLNIGAYQKDISDLQDDEVNWIDGTITRKRSKTKDHKDAPTVTYRLWPETFALLKKFRSGKETVLMTGDGRPWVRAEPQTDGKIKQCDGIARNYRRLVAAHNEKHPDEKLAGRSLKQLRKTASSLLKPKFGDVALHYLAHSPRTVAEKNYIKPSQEQFDAALQWLGEQFGFAPKSKTD